MIRRNFLSMLGFAALALPAAVTPAEAFLYDWKEHRRKQKSNLAAAPKKTAKRKVKPVEKKPAYKGREVVTFRSAEKPGTIIVRTRERALYQVIDDGKAMRYLVAVGKQGFVWSGVARVGMKRKNPVWTPPAEMIERKPEYARWADGMPGGLPDNPLGVRALYLFDKRGDTEFRIHGTNAPSSIGTAASSGCIRMLNSEVTELFNRTPVGTKVIVF